MSRQRRLFLAAGLALLAYGGVVHAAEPEITVYKTPTCGCCTKWVDHLQENGLEVKSVDVRSLNRIKALAGVSPELASCHTAMVDGYVIEGHVPAEDIKRLLAERPEVRGLTVPGMPHGSPGMETGRQDAYQVLTFDADGNTGVFARY
ncbi:DUF411 domain-containing protein [Thioalkalivibrio sp.]|uniref:DUF411 domain-containing protein n=1 Tax=Thioalkalivibrio sp. TaxID=2093813 RepID=UPI003568F93C